MNITSEDIESISKIINPLLGLSGWNVQLGVGSFITIEFGEPIITVNGKPHGEWYLWIYCCGWYLENPNGNFIGSEDPREILKQDITVLERHSIETVEISSNAFETNFVFNLGFVLHTFPLNFIDSCAYWKLYTPQKKILAIGPAPKWSYKLSSESNP